MNKDILDKGKAIVEESNEGEISKTVRRETIITYKKSKAGSIRWSCSRWMDESFKPKVISRLFSKMDASAGDQYGERGSCLVLFDGESSIFLAQGEVQAGDDCLIF